MNTNIHSVCITVQLRDRRRASLFLPNLLLHRGRWTRNMILLLKSSIFNRETGEKDRRGSPSD